MKVCIIVITYNLPSEVTILQVNAIRKFCKDDFEIFIVDNSSVKEMAEATRYHCGQLGVEYMKTNASSVNGSDSHAFAANFSFQRFKYYADMLFYLDHDCIPVAHFSCKEILENKIMAGLGQQGHKIYMWAGCVMLNMSKIDKELVDFSPNVAYKVDTGGQLWVLIEKYGQENCVFFNESYHENPYYKDKLYGSYSMIMNETFLHYTNASNWNPISDNNERINSLINITKEMIDGIKR